jgi:hypothetical protein
MKTSSVPNTTAEELADDLLCGADEIAKFLFGPSGSRRKVNYLAACTRTPVFRLGQAADEVLKSIAHVKGNAWVITGTLPEAPLYDLQPFWQRARAGLKDVRIHDLHQPRSPRARVCR